MIHLSSLEDDLRIGLLTLLVRPRDDIVDGKEAIDWVRDEEL